MDTHPLDLPQRPPIAQAPLSVILLAVGTTSEAAESLSAWQTYLRTLERPFELLLLPIADLEPNLLFDEVRRLPYDAAHGYGPALQAAIAAAQHPLIVLATADGQYQPADLKILLAAIDKADLAIGCRTVAPRPWWLRALGWLFRVLGRLLIGLPLHGTACTPGATRWRRRWVARWVFGLRLLDPESAFRLGRREALVRIVLQSRGPFALVEQLAKGNHLELLMAEEPIAWSPPAQRPPETVSFGQEARALLHRPDFGPPELHVPPLAPLPAEKPPAPPTEAASPSS
jgi:hypothetical protein